MLKDAYGLIILFYFNIVIFTFKIAGTEPRKQGSLQHKLYFLIDIFHHLDNNNNRTILFYFIFIFYTIAFLHYY